MLGWVVRILFAIAAPITALFVARDALNFGLIQTMVTMLLVTGLVWLMAAYAGETDRRPRKADATQLFRIPMTCPDQLARRLLPNRFAAGRPRVSEGAIAAVSPLQLRTSP